MEKTGIGLDKKTTEQVSVLLQKILSDEYILYTKTRNFHWNVKGPQFYGRHKLFENLYEELNESINEIAERIRMIGEYPKASLKEFLEIGTIKEANTILKSNDMTKELCADHATLIREIRESIEKISELKDNGTEDFLVALMQKHEKTHWILLSLTEE